MLQQSAEQSAASPDLQFLAGFVLERLDSSNDVARNEASGVRVLTAPGEAKDPTRAAACGRQVRRNPSPCALGRVERHRRDELLEDLKRLAEVGHVRVEAQGVLLVDGEAHLG